MNRFYKDELGPKFQHGIRVCRIQGPPTYPCTKPKKELGMRGVYWGKPKPHIESIRLLIRVYKEEALLTL